MARKLEVQIVGDASSYERSLKRASRETQKFNRSITQSTRGAAAGSGAFRSMGRSVAFASGSFLGTAGLTATLKRSIDAASNLAEQTSKVRVIFGRSAPEIVRWGQTTAASIGIANDQALEAAGTFGNLFTTVGLAPAKNAALSRSLVQLAADLASFNNASPEDTLDALRSGLIGEAEPLRRFGVLLTETRVQQEAMRETGKRTARQLTDQEKILARYNLILQDTAPAQGDFARTSDGLANSQRTLSAEVRDLSAALGNQLKPAVEAVVKTLADGIAPQDKHADRTKKINLQSRLLNLTLRGSGAVLKQWKKDIEQEIGPVVTLADALNKLTQAASHIKPITITGVRERQPGRSPGGAAPFPLIAGVPVRHRASLAFQISLLQEQLAKAELTAGQRDDRAALVRMKNLLKRRIAVTKDLGDRTALYQQLGSVQDQIAQIDAKGAADRKAAQEKELDARKKVAEDAKRHAEKVKALAKQAALAAQVRLVTAQFRQLGFGPGGADLIPSGRELLKRLGKIKDQVKGTVLDTQENRKLLDRIRRTLLDGLGKLAPEVRQKVQELLDALDVDAAAKKRGKRAKSPLEEFAGLGSVVSSGLTRMGAPIGVPVPKEFRPNALNVQRMEVHIYGVQNVREFENELAKRSKQRPHARRGP